MAITPSWALYKVGSGSWGVVVKKWQLDILESKIVGWNLRCHIWRRENILQFAIFSFLIFNYLFSYFICFFSPPSFLFVSFNFSIFHHFLSQLVPFPALLPLFVVLSSFTLCFPSITLSTIYYHIFIFSVYLSSAFQVPGARF